MSAFGDRASIQPGATSVVQDQMHLERGRDVGFDGAQERKELNIAP